MHNVMPLASLNADATLFQTSMSALLLLLILRISVRQTPTLAVSIQRDPSNVCVSLAISEVEKLV